MYTGRIKGVQRVYKGRIKVSKQNVFKGTYKRVYTLGVKGINMMLTHKDSSLRTTRTRHGPGHASVVLLPLPGACGVHQRGSRRAVVDGR